MKFLDINLIESLSHSRGYIRTQNITVNYQKFLNQKALKVDIIDRINIVLSFKPDYSSYWGNGRFIICAREFNTVRTLLYNKIGMSRIKIVVHFVNGSYTFFGCKDVSSVKMSISRFFEVNFGDKLVMFVE